MALTDQYVRPGRSNRHDDHRDSPAASAAYRRPADQKGSVPPVTTHARERWAERAPAADIALETAWRRAITISAPARDCDSARLYAPCDVLFVRRGGVIATVCPANYDSLETTQLGQCPACGNLDVYPVGGKGCRWCGHAARSVQMDNGIELTFAGGG